MIKQTASKWKVKQTKLEGRGSFSMGVFKKYMEKGCSVVFVFLDE